MNKKYILILSFLLNASFSKAQSDVSIMDYFDNLSFNPTHNLPWFGIAKNDKILLGKDFPGWYVKEILKSEHISFKLVKTEIDELGFTHNRYIEEVNGIPVYHSSFIVHELNGVVESFNGNVYPIESHDLTKILSMNQVLKMVLEEIGAKVYKWEDPIFEGYIKNEQDNLEATYYPKGELVVSGKFRDEYGGPFKVCYKFPIAAVEPFLDEMVLVDAFSGKIFWRENMIVDADSNGKANTYFRGYKNIVADFVTSNSFKLHDSKHKLKTYKGAIGTDFVDTDNDWDNTGEKQAGDVHWGAKNVFDFLDVNFGFNSYDNKGGNLISILNLSGSGNAFWNLSGNNATFLAAKSGTTEPCIALDVVGHEFGHGVADEIAGLIYSGQSCMLHESFADINGQNVEWFADSTKHNWKIGEEVWPSSGGIRNMKNPHLFSHPKNYLGTYWSSGGCHNPGEVQNYFYYLIAVGDTGTNDFSYKYALKGLGRAKANKIYYRSMRYYVTPTHQFTDMVKTTLKAAKDLYGNCSNEYNTVYQAWKIVNLEDTTLKGVDFSHGIVSGTKFCGTLPTNVAFGSIGDISRKVTWSFGKNDTSNLFTLTHVYNSTGAKKVFLTTRVCNKVFYDSTIVNINLIPKADFTISAGPYCQSNDSVRFTNTSINKDATLKLDYNWTIDPILSKSTSKNFALSMNNDPRQYVVSLLAHYSTGCDDLKKDTFVLYSNPVPTFTSKSVCEGQPVKIVNTTDTIGQSLAFIWKSGIQTSTLFNPTNISLGKGVQNIELYAKSAISGCSAKVTNQVEIWENPVPTFDYLNNCKGQQLKLINTTNSPRPLLWFEWDLGIFKPQNKDTFLYKIPSDSNSLWIGLRMVDNRSCIGETFKKVDILSVLADFSIDSVCKGAPTNCINKSTFVGEMPDYEWTFGDSSKASLNTNEKHKYKLSGNYLITLKAQNSICSSKKQKVALVYETPKANFLVNDICSGDTAKFQNKSVFNGPIPTWYWEFGDTQKDTARNPKHNYIVSQTQTNIVTLISTNIMGCSDTFTNAINISELPKPTFSYSNYGNNYFKFKSTGNGYNIVEWDFGDGTYSTELEPIHKFPTSGIYIVKLKVENTGNCAAIASVTKGDHSGIKSTILSNFEMFPNPSNGLVTFRGLSKGAKVEIVNSIGQVVFETIVESKSYLLDFSHFSKGIYSVKVMLEDDIAVRKLAIE